MGFEVGGMEFILIECDMNESDPSAGAQNPEMHPVSIRTPRTQPQPPNTDDHRLSPPIHHAAIFRLTSFDNTAVTVVDCLLSDAASQVYYEG